MAEVSCKTESSLEKLSGASITVLTVTPEVSVDKLSGKTEVGMGGLASQNESRHG
jgi:hypothetical protein